MLKFTAAENKSNADFPFLITTIGSFSIIVVLAIQNVNGQTADMSLTKLLENKFFIQNFEGADGTVYHNTTLIHVLYESPKTILLSGYLIEAGVFNSDLWKARDLLKNQYGFKMHQVITTGMGTEVPLKSIS